jgi:hypothetical protein
MESVSNEEREYFNALYGRELTDGEIDEIMRPLVDYLKVLIETKKENPL